MLSVRNATPGDIELIRDLSHEIWPDTYGDILTTQQMEYMLAMMYSPASLATQMQEHTFILCEEDGKPCGFASYGTLDDDIWKLHKIYLLPSMQGKGAGKLILNYVTDDIKSKDAHALQLNVNRHNRVKAFYEKAGFKVIREEDIDIGNGYFMNDYVMQLDIK